MHDELVARMSDHIVRQFAPARIILFGSRASGKAGSESDVDLLVVMPTSVHRRHTAVAIRRLLAEYPVAKDIVVTTAAQLVQRAGLIGTIEHAAAAHGKVIYAR